MACLDKCKRYRNGVVVAKGRQAHFRRWVWLFISSSFLHEVASIHLHELRAFVDSSDHITFPPNSSLPSHFLRWRPPVQDSYTISPPDHPGTLRLRPSRLNLTALDGNYAGPEGQTFVGRRQSHTLFSFGADLEFNPQKEEEEAGISAFLTQEVTHESAVAYVIRWTYEGLGQVRS